MMNKITIEHMDLWYGDFHALKDVNLNLPANQITALIGPSGCGWCPSIWSESAITR